MNITNINVEQIPHSANPANDHWEADINLYNVMVEVDGVAYQMEVYTNDDASHVECDTPVELTDEVWPAEAEAAGMEGEEIQRQVWENTDELFRAVVDALPEAA